MNFVSFILCIVDTQNDLLMACFSEYLKNAKTDIFFGNSKSSYNYCWVIRTQKNQYLGCLFLG